MAATQTRNSPTAVPDAFASAIFREVRKGACKKEVARSVHRLQESLKARCPDCESTWAVIFLSNADVHHFYLLARRSTYRTLRRRICDEYAKLRIRCSSCMDRQQHESGAEQRSTDLSSRMSLLPLE